MAHLDIRNITKTYDGQPVLRDVSLAVARGEIVCLLGPSGCGKTTLLRIVAGLEQADAGAVIFEGVDLSAVPVYRRGFGLMFQEFALFPHKSVAENVAFGLRMAGWEAARIRARVAEMLALVNLPGYQRRSVLELSGGERQRVALARSLAPSPRLLMLDEPLGSLDRGLREELMTELRVILKRVDVTALYVTHDQQEAYAIADRIAVMRAGQFQQIAPPEELYTRPASPFVARFLGFSNLLGGTVSGQNPRAIATAVGTFQLAQPQPPGAHTLLIRPEIGPESIDATGSAGALAGRLEAVSFRGSDYHLRLAVELSGEGGEAVESFEFVLPTRHRRSRGERLPAVGAGLRIGVEISQLVVL